MSLNILFFQNYFIHEGCYSKFVSGWINSIVLDFLDVKNHCLIFLNQNKSRKMPFSLLDKILCVSISTRFQDPRTDNKDHCRNDPPYYVSPIVSFLHIGILISLSHVLDIEPPRTFFSVIIA